MRAVLLILSLVLTCGSFAQTKEETIQWLKEKISKNYFYYVLSGEDHVRFDDVTKFKEIRIDECKIILKYDNGYQFWEEIFPVVNNMIVNEYGFIMYKSNLISVSDNFKVKDETREKRSYKSRLSFYRFGNNEDDLFERMTKALQHLSSFCKEDKNEVF